MASVAVLTVMAFSFCWYHLTARSIWLDEGASLSIASQHGIAFLRGLLRDGGNQATYYLVLHVVIAIGGTHVTTLRVTAALASAAVVPLTFSLGRRIGSDRLGVYAAALVAVCVSLVYWGQMARGYTLAAVLGAASGRQFVLLVRRARPPDVALFVVCTTLLCYTELLGTLVVAAEVAAALLAARQPVRMRRFVVGIAGTVFCCTPLLVLAAARGSSQLFWLGRPTPRVALAGVRFLAGVLTPFRGHWESTALLVGTLCLVGIALVAVPFDRRHPRTTDRADATLFAGLWLVVPPLVAYGFSLIAQPIFLDRYFSPSLPALALLLALVLDRLRPAVFGFALLVVIMTLRFTQIPPSYHEVRDNWRDATASLLSRTESRDCIAFDTNDGWIDFDYYLTAERGAASESTVPRPVLPAIAFGSHPLIVEQYSILSTPALERATSTCGRLWLVVSHVGGTSASDQTNLANEAAYRVFVEEIGRAFPAVSEVRFTAIDEYLFSRS